MKNKNLQDLLIKEINVHEFENLKTFDKSDKWLTNQYQKAIEEKIASLSTSEEKIAFINNYLPDNDKMSQFQINENRKMKIAEDLSLNKLVVSFKDFIEEEFLNSNEVLMISPFISSFMVNKLRTWMICNKKVKVKIITTTFDGTSKFLSLETLIELKKDFGERIDVKIENSFKNNGSRIHMKCYCFLRDGGFSNLYVGSNNFTRTGIMVGNEYSIKISEFREDKVMADFISEFYALWNKNLVDLEDIDEINKIILSQSIIDEISREKEKQIEYTNKLLNDDREITLYDYQQEVIDIIAEREKAGISKHLVIMATGTGKTITIAKYFEKIFHDSKDDLKILFIAHQKEILDQGIATFEKVVSGFENHVCRLYDQQYNENELKEKKYIFATFQSLNKNLDKINGLDFDLTVVDEVHHIEAKSYQKVFELASRNSKTLIGLTATPERTEGIDINKYFNYEYAYNLSLYKAMSSDLLAPFDYYFIKDDTVDLSGVDLNKKEELGNILSTDERNKFIYSNIKKMIGKSNRDTSTVLFCSSINHANKLKEFLCDKNLRCEVLTSLNNKKERQEILEKFKNKEINYLCVRDILNEGVDIPNIDRIMFLRPTNSLVIYLQQLGRGLRKIPDKKLQIYDFVNNVDLYVNKNYDPLLIYRAFKDENKIKIRELINNSFKIGSFLPEGSEIYMDFLTKETLINKIKEFESNKKISNILNNYLTDISYSSYERMFLDNNFIKNFTLFNFYKKKTFLKENNDYMLTFSRMSINNNREVIKRWLDICLTKKIDLLRMEDKLFISNFCNCKITDNKFKFEDDLINFWEVLKSKPILLEELIYLFQFKLKNEELLSNSFLLGQNETEINAFKEMYVTYDQINIILGEGIYDNKFKKNASVSGIYKVGDNKYAISASSLTKDSEHKHSNYYFDKNKELVWESPDSWKFESNEKINLAYNNYHVFYQSHETAEKFNDTIRKYLGKIESINSKESIKNNKEIKENKIRYKFKIS